MHRDEHLGRVADLPESLACHLENSKLRGGTETVLYASQQAVCTPVFSFELQDNIDDVLQNLRPCDAALLGYVADQDYRHPCFLGKAEQEGGSLLDLGNRARRRLHILRKHGLDGVHDHQVRHDFTSLLENVLHQGFAVDEAVGVVSSDAGCTEFHLTRAFLTGDVQGFQMRAVKRNLQRQGGFADAGLTPDQHKRAFHEAAAENPVHLPVAQGDTAFL